MKGKWEWGIIIFSIWLKQYKSNRNERLLFRGKMFIELKVVCIDLHAGPNEGHYGDLIVLQMHQRGLTSWVSPLWMTCCILLLLPNFSQAELPFSLTSHLQIECSPTKDCLTQKSQISPYLRKRSVIFLKSRGGILPFLMFQFPTLPDLILLFDVHPNVRLFSYFWKKAEYRPQRP